MVLPAALTIPARALTSVTSTVEKSAMTQPPEQPPTQVSAQRRSGCGTLLVALLVLAIITAIVIFLGASGLLDWISVHDGSADTPVHWKALGSTYS